MDTLTDSILSRVGGLQKNDLNELASDTEYTSERNNLLSESPYYEVNNINTVINSDRHLFSILSLNIQSIRSKFDQFSSLLETLKEKNVIFSAICIQESGLDNNFDTNSFDIPGYKLISQGKSASEKGGLVIYLKDSYSFTIRHNYNNSSLWEGLVIDVFHETFSSKITIANIYRPPKFNNNNQTLTNFINEIGPLITSLSKQKSHTLISGDFNINLLDIDSRIKIQEYFDIFVTKGFFPRIIHPTRFSKKRGTLIDQIYSNLPLSSGYIKSGLLHTLLSDHLPYFTSFEILPQSNKNNPKYVKINRYDDNSIEAFSEDLRNFINGQNFNSDLLTNPNKTYNKIEECIQKSTDIHLQPKIVRLRRRKHKINPWITNGILKSIAYKDHLYKK